MLLYCIFSLLAGRLKEKTISSTEEGEEEEEEECREESKEEHQEEQEQEEERKGGLGRRWSEVSYTQPQSVREAAKKILPLVVRSPRGGDEGLTTKGKNIIGNSKNWKEKSSDGN